MPAVKFSRAAVRDLERVVSFLEETNPNAAAYARDTIGEVLALLERFPEVGRSARQDPATRVFATGFGKSGYVFRYRIDFAGNVVILSRRSRNQTG